MKQISVLEWILRIAVFGTFLGHGIFAIKQNPVWIPFLTHWGIDQQVALNLMIAIGTLDLCIALITLLRPNKYVLMYAAIWAFAAALMRPITGASIWTFVERAANWCAPLALLWLRRKRLEGRSSH